MYLSVYLCFCSSTLDSSMSTACELTAPGDILTPVVWPSAIFDGAVLESVSVEEQLAMEELLVFGDDSTEKSSLLVLVKLVLCCSIMLALVYRKL